MAKHYSKHALCLIVFFQIWQSISLQILKLYDETHFYEISVIYYENKVLFHRKNIRQDIWVGTFWIAFVEKTNIIAFILYLCNVKTSEKNFRTALGYCVKIYKQIDNHPCAYARFFPH